jgi:hypothetical protein
MLTGAAGSSGFKGLGGRFARAGLMRIAPELPLSLRYRRLDTGVAVDAAAILSLAPADPALHRLIERSAREGLDGAAMAELGRLWQERVRFLLLEASDDPAIFIVRIARRTDSLQAGRIGSQARFERRAALTARSTHQ